MKKLLRIDSSARQSDSISRQLADVLQARIEQQGAVTVQKRDLYYEELVKLGNEDQVNGYFTPADQQTEAQQHAVAGSNILATEFAQADEYLFAVPMYNFGVSAALKTYIDLISRVGVTFKYGEGFPIGLLENKKAYVIVVTGGTPLESDYDFVIPYLKVFLNFVGITNIEFIKAASTRNNIEQALIDAKNNINTLEIS
ncbi:FMN-dependent NADH-azoreductase [Aquimarina sp. AU474]|uniref:FMN-dependent NADH-azoreductase n=1 Tax=Aquimarina sp. AU474 TaxID=2108529 RepID=UPI000D690E8B|nr:NAD(P)H-dependent oxidoreductase [Aquimarina sp. AU474]